MTEYTAHIQAPDAPTGAILHDQLLDRAEVSCAALRSGGGTWLSVGIRADSDDEATMTLSTLRYQISAVRGITPPEGYSEDFLASFEHAPMILCHGRTVVHSE